MSEFRRITYRRADGSVFYESNPAGVQAILLSPGMKNYMYQVGRATMGAAVGYSEKFSESRNYQRSFRVSTRQMVDWKNKVPRWGVVLDNDAPYAGKIEDKYHVLDKTRRWAIRTYDPYRNKRLS